MSWGGRSRRGGRKWHYIALKTLVSRMEMAGVSASKSREASPGQFDGAAQKAAWIRALPDEDLEPPRLQNAIEVLADEGQILDRKPPRHNLALTGRENGLLHPLKLQEWLSDARDGIAHEQEQRGLPIHPALVINCQRHLEAVIP